ncbi:hypothetical protein TYRP_002245 [Tyrophagus putrescentiae]|nr:hypothetical protein TYRP_002245 [Tyrophagus putrescentiae]
MNRIQRRHHQRVVGVGTHIDAQIVQRIVAPIVQVDIVSGQVKEVALQVDDLLAHQLSVLRVANVRRRAVVAIEKGGITDQCIKVTAEDGLVEGGAQPGSAAADLRGDVAQLLQVTRLRVVGENLDDGPVVKREGVLPVQEDGLEDVAQQRNGGRFNEDAVALMVVLIVVCSKRILRHQLLHHAVQLNGQIALDVDVTGKVLHAGRKTRGEAENRVHTDEIKLNNEQ